MAHHHHHHHYSEIKRVTIVNGLVNFLLAVVKMVIGYVGHSQALIADGLHSFSDLLSDALVILAAKAGGKQPDKDHPYGHRRIETMAAIVIAIMLTGVGLGLAYDTVYDLWHGIDTPHPSIAVIITAIISIVANEWLYRYTNAYGKKLKSNLLHSNAYHKRSDAMVSVIVLASVVGTYFGLSYLDAVAAFIIGALIIKMGLHMVIDSIRELMDTSVDQKTLKQIIRQIKHVPGVCSIHQLRTRSLGGSIFVDVHIIVDSKISVSEGHHIAEEVHLGLVKRISNVMDVTVHIDPEDDEKSMPSIDLPNRVKAEELLKQCWHDLPEYTHIQKIVLHYLDGRLDVAVIMQAKEGKTMNAELEKTYKAAASEITAIADLKIYYHLS